MCCRPLDFDCHALRKRCLYPPGSRSRLEESGDDRADGAWRVSSSVQTTCSSIASDYPSARETYASVHDVIGVGSRTRTMELCLGRGRLEVPRGAYRTPRGSQALPRHKCPDGPHTAVTTPDLHGAIISIHTHTHTHRLGDGLWHWRRCGLLAVHKQHTAVHITARSVPTSRNCSLPACM
jgi:hypothetical protein